jgi:CRP/FNR family transcriptional regulator
MNCAQTRFGTCHHCSKRGHAVVDLLGRGTLDTLDRVRITRNLAAGEVLFSQGEAATGLHCLSAGLMALKAVNDQGAPVLMGLARGGDLIGYASFLTNGTHALTAEALLPSRLCSIPARTGHALMLSDPQFAGMMARACLREAQAHRARMIAFAGRSNDARLAMILAAMLSVQGKDGAFAQMRLPLSRQDLASALSIAPETLSRVLHRLTESGILSLEGRVLTVHSVARLRALAENRDEPEIAGYLAELTRPAAGSGARAVASAG